MAKILLVLKLKTALDQTYSVAHRDYGEQQRGTTTVDLSVFSCGFALSGHGILGDPGVGRARGRGRAG